MPGRSGNTLGLGWQGRVGNTAGQVAVLQGRGGNTAGQVAVLQGRGGNTAGQGGGNTVAMHSYSVLEECYANPDVALILEGTSYTSHTVNLRCITKLISLWL